MRLNTKHFGAINIEENDIFSFEEGLPGFEYTKKYILIKNEDLESPFHWLQSVDRPEYAFVVVDPFKAMEDYTIDVPDSDIEALGIDTPEDMFIYCIVVIPEDITRISANLKAPVIMNSRLKRGKQVLLENNTYSIRHYLAVQSGQGV